MSATGIPMTRSEVSDRPMLALATPPTLHISEGKPVLY